MKTDIRGDVAMLDKETKEQIEAAGERLFGRLRERIADLDVHVGHIALTGATICQVTVHTANRIQILARHRDRDALKAALTALQRARLQVGRALRRTRQRRLYDLSAATS